MAAGLTDHIWSFQELLSYRIAPVPWVEAKRRGRPKKQAASPTEQTTLQQVWSRARPLLRLRKGILCPITS